MQCIKFALVQTVAADYATGIVHRAVLEVNGLRLAVFLTHTAVFALVLVETDAEQ